jgi:hypothetical protein
MLAAGTDMHRRSWRAARSVEDQEERGSGGLGHRYEEDCRDEQAQDETTWLIRLNAGAPGASLWSVRNKLSKGSCPGGCDMRFAGPTIIRRFYRSAACSAMVWTGRKPRISVCGAPLPIGRPAT